jgi:hypothetical protein
MKQAHVTKQLSGRSNPQVPKVVGAQVAEVRFQHPRLTPPTSLN